MQCQICKDASLATAPEHQMQACTSCAEKVGLVPMPAVTRPARACSCGGRKFMRCIPREHTAGNLGHEANRQVSAPMMLTQAPTGGKMWLLGGYADAIDVRKGFGSLEVFVCYACGKVEWYCGDVANIPIHPHLMTDVVDYDAGGPYR